MTTREAINTFRNRLQGCYPARELESMVRIIFEEVLLWQPVDIVMRENTELPQFFDARLDDIITRLAKQEPLQYILGKARFHGHSFAVTPATLIPRPETEQLVDMIVDDNPAEDLQVLDIGTGSGCIAISLARALKFAAVTAIDVSDEALEVTRSNAAALKTRITVLKRDILSCRPEEEKYDIIVSNPPYITLSEKATMEPNVLDYEPHGALFVPNDDPMKFNKAIAAFAQRSLKNNGKLYLEINSKLADMTTRVLADHGLTPLKVVKDFNGMDRFVAAVKKSY